MKLKSFNPQSVPNLRAGSDIPTVSLNYSSGVMTFNKGACEFLKLKKGDQVVIHQDEEEPQDWYIQKVPEGGFELRGKTTEEFPLALAFNNATLIRQIIDSVAYEVPEGVETETPKSVKVKINKPTEIKGDLYYCIILTTAEARF